MFSRKTEPHQKCSSSTPPTTGPRAAPAVAAAPQMPIAVARSRSSGKRVRISDSVDGMIVAPATPSSARARISQPAVGEYAASSEAAPNAVEPISSRRLRPIRSLSEPIETSSPASTKE